MHHRMERMGGYHPIHPPHPCPLATGSEVAFSAPSATRVGLVGARSVTAGATPPAGSCGRPEQVHHAPIAQYGLATGPVIDTGSHPPQGTVSAPIRDPGGRSSAPACRNQVRLVM